MNYTHIVTGAEGFIGKHVTKQLLNSGIPVVGIVQSFKPPVEHNLYTRVVGDVTSDQTWYRVSKLLEENALNPCFSVIHLAAPTAHNDLHNAAKMYKYHTKASVAISSFCNREKIQLVYASSGKVYGKNARGLINDSTKPEPTTILGKAKLIGETVAKTCCDKPVKIARIFDVFGFGQKSGYLFPDILNQLAMDKTEICIKNSSVLRDWLHVSDVADSLIKLGYCSDVANEPFRIASGVSRSPADVIADMSAILSIPLTVLLAGSSKRKNEEKAEFVVPSIHANSLYMSCVWLKRLEETMRQYLKPWEEVNK